MFSKLFRPAVARAAVRFVGAGARRAQRTATVSSSFGRATAAGLFTGATALALTTVAVSADGGVGGGGGAAAADGAAGFLAGLSKKATAAFEKAKELVVADAKLAASAPDQILWNAIRKDIENIIDDENSLNPGVDGFPGNTGGGGDVGPMLVRLAWHCAGSYDAASGTGGSNGATMRFAEGDHGGNAGLGHARALLEPIKAKYGKLGATYADIYIFAGCVAIEAMGGPALPFRTGRTDADGPADPSVDKRFSPDGRLPDADGRDTDPANHLRDIFHRMGFTDREIVALSGAHAMGRCHTDRSGFWGPWTNAPTTFSNEYFVVLEEKDWYVKRSHKGAKWTGPLQYEDSTGELMMLPTDLALIHDREFRPVVAEYYKNEDKFTADFANAWTTLTELGCDGILSDTPIVNLDEVASGANEQIAAAVEDFRASLGEIKAKAAAKTKKGWFW